MAKKIRIGINGLGRIGRLVLRAAQHRDDIEIVYMNGTCPVDYQAYMIKYDTMQEDNTRYFLLGDQDWCNPKKEAKGEVLHSIPEVVASDFELDQVQVLYEASLPEDDPRAEGTYVHDFLSGLADFPQSEADFEQCLVEVPEEKKPRLRDAYHHIMEDADLRPCFAPGVKVLNEVNILDEVHEEHRPDRVVFLDDKVVVIDYKTGSPHPQYQQQIDEYCALLRNMGYQNVEGRLLYV